MTFELTNERLQDIAINAVSKFMNKEASLSEALAKEAMDLEMNPDQIKRAIEATNTIAYLRQLEKSADRTFEFPVADYSHVMASMCLPDEMAKQAGTPPWLDKDKDKKEDDKEDDKGKEKDKEDSDDKDEKTDKGENFGKSDKKESKDSKEDKGSDEKEDGKDEEKSEPDSDEDKQEKRAMLNKALFQAKDELRRMEYDEYTICMDLVKSAESVYQDCQGLDKLAFVVEDRDLDKAIKLCGIEKRASEDLIFVDKDLTEVKKFYSLYKQANEFVQRKEMLQDFVKRSEQVLFHKTANVEKLASIIGSVGGALGSAAGFVGGKLFGAGKALVTKPFQGSLSFRQAAKAKGFKSVAEATSHYDSIKLNQGSNPLTAWKGRNAARAAFGGTAPSMIGRVGLVGAGTALTGLGVDHAYNVNKDIK